MSNLNELRRKVGLAVSNGDVTVTLGTEEAKLYLREMESLHGGNHVSDVYVDQIARLNAEMVKLKAALRVPSEEVDKVASLLPGGE